jgi:dimethylhistidine N-methyltransferase
MTPLSGWPPPVADAPAADTPVTEFAEQVRYYLTQSPRQLPSRYLYDALGSALFDAICELPWYGVTRTEMRMLTTHGTEILEAMQPLARIIELGAGNGRKLERLLAAAPTAHTQEVHLIDVSPQALRTATDALNGFEHVRIHRHVATYEAGLQRLAHGQRAARRSLLLFLGSNIGNFDPPAASALLLQIRAALGPGDGFLIGADLVKPERELRLAYDDPLHVTSAFNRNLLVRINRELDANFELNDFVHRAVWNRAESRVEMHLVSTRAQSVVIRAARLTLRFKKGESIWTESSYKYDPQTIVRQLQAAGFGLQEQWVDRTAGFALTLVTA